MMRILEKTKEEFQQKLKTMATPLIKVNYLEDALRGNLDISVKSWIGDILNELYIEMKMFDKAARALSNKASLSTSFREKMELYTKAGELYAKAQRLEDSENMYVKAMRETTPVNQQQIKVLMKNAWLTVANHLENTGRRSSAMKFYERLIKMPLQPSEKADIKAKLMLMYRNMGRYSEMKILEGI